MIKTSPTMKTDFVLAMIIQNAVRLVFGLFALLGIFFVFGFSLHHEAWTPMMKLTRFASFDDRTLGRLVYDDQVFWTIERPWLDNRVCESCIPNGLYRMIRVNSPKFGPNMWEIADVVDRTHIIIHIANYSDDVLGCVGLGSGLFPNLEGVSGSRKAVEAFYRRTDGITEERLLIKTGALQ